METRAKVEQDITVITIRGSLNIEVAQPFGEACVQSLIGRKVVFNMKQTHFVGSTGVQVFIDTLKTLSSGSPFGLKLVGLNPEFKRIFQNLELATLEFHEDEKSALSSFK
jgi:anti-anti-sigma factor